MNTRKAPVFTIVMLLILGMVFVVPVGAQDASPGDPSDNGIQPEVVDGNPDCGDVGYGYGFKVEGSPEGTFYFTSADGELTGGAPEDNSNYVTISNVQELDGSDVLFDWAASLGIDAVIVKGGPNANLYEYDPESTGDGSLHPPVNPNNDKLFGISHIEFCYDYEPVDPGTITILKLLEDPEGLTGYSFDFTDTIEDPYSFALAHGEQKVFTEVSPGQYTVIEQDPTDNFVLSDLYCEDSDNEGQDSTIDMTAATATINLDAGEEVTCVFINKEGPPDAVTLASFTASAGVGAVNLSWETGTEVDNAGFNLYRATAAGGPYTKVNAALIAAEGDPVSGASYSYLDQRLQAGTYFYKLEDVDLSGVVTKHGPVSATVLPRFRRPAYRPTWPGR